MNVSEPPPATPTSLRMRAPISPAASATPTPIMAMNTTATTLNPAKLLTNDEKKNEMPSRLSMLSISVVSCWTSSWSASR